MTSSIPKTASSSAIGIDAITDDLLMEVLQRLPPKDFARAQAVSKRFCDVSVHRTYPEQHPEMLRRMAASARGVPALAKTLKHPRALIYSKSTPFLEVHSKAHVPPPFDPSGLPSDWRPRLLGPRYVTCAPAALQQIGGFTDALGNTMSSLRNLACNCQASPLNSRKVLTALYQQVRQAMPPAGPSQALTAAAIDDWQSRAEQGIMAVYHAPKLAHLPYPLYELLNVVVMLATRHEALDPSRTAVERRALHVAILQAMAQTPQGVVSNDMATQVPIACRLIEVLRGHRVVRGLATLEPALFRPDDPCR